MAPLTRPSGSRYAVAGSGGQVSSAPLDHPVMVASLLELGSMVVDVAGPELDARFVNSSGLVTDSFRIEKGPKPPGWIFGNGFETGTVCAWSSAEGTGGC